MIKIAMFNNKGGVGKTTLTCNLAFHFSNVLNKKVLLVDCDPQCNATQLVMGIDYATDLYWNSNNSNTFTTINDVLQPIQDGDAKINDDIKPIPSGENRFKVALIPGHPRLSIIEDKLSESWQQLVGGDLGGIRKSNWNNALTKKIENNYDIIFYDLGPSLGSINRSVLIGCNHFVTPMGSDIFSILGIRNISAWFSSWIALYENGLSLSEKQTSGKLAEYGIPKELSIKNGYLGYTIQQYISKTVAGVKRATKAYEEIIKSVPEEVKLSFEKFSPHQLTINDLKLGDVPHLYSLIPLGQSAASPILELKSSDGLIGPQFKQLEQYKLLIDSISDRIEKNLKKITI